MKKTIATGVLGAALLFAGIVPAIAGADPTDTGIATSPGLQQNCAFNPAFNKMHAGACGSIGVGDVAGNGGPADADGDGNPDFNDPTPNG